MGDRADHGKLLRALARLVAARKDIGDRRKDLQRHASARLDATAHATKVSADALAGDQADNPLVFRYHRTQLTEGARLRAIEGRGVPDAEPE